MAWLAAPPTTAGDDVITNGEDEDLGKGPHVCEDEGEGGQRR